jgi:2-(1,2-epoxy-1,2-dihydrophenyl)acetyl-CoA isomerase
VSSTTVGAKLTEVAPAGMTTDAGTVSSVGSLRRLPAENLDGEVAALAAQLRNGPPIALAFTKRAIRRSLDLGRDAEFDYEVFAQVNCIQTEDHHEGVRAFFDEKRAPVFKGR